MADGDEWSLDRIACDYVSDTGATFRFKALERYQSQAALGWVACTDPTVMPAPKGIKPRKWLLWDAGNHALRRSVVVATNTAFAAGVIGTTTLAVQNPSTDVEDTFTLYAKEGERSSGIQRD